MSNIFDKANTAWFDHTKQSYIHIPVFALDGTELTHLSFQADGNMWVCEVSDNIMREVIDAAMEIKEKHESL
jgi:hypothetical protein